MHFRFCYTDVNAMNWKQIEKENETNEKRNEKQRKEEEKEKKKRKRKERKRKRKKRDVQGFSHASEVSFSAIEKEIN